MSVTFQAIRLVEGVWCPIEDSPELNVANGNAAAILRVVFQVEPDELMGDLHPAVALGKLEAFADQPRQLLKEPSVSQSNGVTIYEGGRVADQVARYVEKLRDVCNVALDHGARMGWA